MTLSLPDCTFIGPALPEPFVLLQLEELLLKEKLLPRAAGPEAKKLGQQWDLCVRKLRKLGGDGLSIRVRNHVLEPLVEPLGYAAFTAEQPVSTREGEEDGGWIMTAGTSRLRCWACDASVDLEAPSRRGRAYRFSPGRIAERVLLAKGERVGLLTNGDELRLLLCDPARPGSHVAIRLDRGQGGWASKREPPDSFRLLVALASPAGVEAIPKIVERARLNQTKVTSTLRVQAREAVRSFVQAILDRDDNREVLARSTDRSALAASLWREGHLHPSAQSELADAIIDASIRKRVQFIIESHSEHFLRRLQRRVAEGEDAGGIRKDHIALYKCEIAEDASHVTRLETDDLGNIINWPKDFFGDEVGDLVAMSEAAARREGAK